MAMLHQNLKIRSLRCRLTLSPYANKIMPQAASCKQQVMTNMQET